MEYTITSYQKQKKFYGVPSTPQSQALSMTCDSKSCQVIPWSSMKFHPQQRNFPIPNYSTVPSHIKAGPLLVSKVRTYSPLSSLWAEEAQQVQKAGQLANLLPRIVSLSGLNLLYAPPLCYIPLFSLVLASFFHYP